MVSASGLPQIVIVADEFWERLDGRDGIIICMAPGFDDVSLEVDIGSVALRALPNVSVSSSDLHKPDGSRLHEVFASAAPPFRWVCEEFASSSPGLGGMSQSSMRVAGKVSFKVWSSRAGRLCGVPPRSFVISTASGLGLLTHLSAEETLKYAGRSLLLIPRDSCGLGVPGDLFPLPRVFVPVKFVGRCSRVLRHPLASCAQFERSNEVIDSLVWSASLSG